jgi:hypothetical protein
VHPEQVDLFAVMVVLAVAGLALLVSAPFLARLLTRGRDSVGLTRILLAVAVVLLLAALLLRPHNDETAAFKPPPDAPADAR